MVSILFDVLWVVVGFVALRWIGRSVFVGNWRPEAFAAAVVAAFALGVWWPFSDRHLTAPQTAAAPAAPVVAPPVAVAPSRDVSAICRQVGAVKTTSPGAFGSLDVFGAMAAGHPTAQPSGFRLARNATLAVQGWAAEEPTKSPAMAACLVVDGKVAPRATEMYGISRPDVANAYHTDAMTATGYLLTLDARALTPGEHAIGFLVVTSSGAVAHPSTDTVVVP